MIRTEILGGPFLWGCAITGLAIGLATLRMAEMPNRWVIAALAGLFVTLAGLASGRPRRAALFVFVFSLQIGLALYLTTPLPVSSVGISWPNSLALPLASLAAAGSLAVGRGRPFLWGGAVGVWAGLVILTTAVSTPGSPVRFIGLSHVVLLLAYFIVFLAAANAVHDKDDLELVLRVLMLSLALQCGIYFAQNLAGGTFTPSGEWIDQSQESLGRYGGTVGKRPAMFSSFLLPLLLLAVTHFLTTADRKARRYYGVVAATGCGALALTFTRASWMAFTLGLVYVLVAGARRGVLVRRNVGVLFLVLLVVALALSPKILRRASDDHLAAIEERWALVEMALRVIQAHPLAGVGAGAYPYVFRDYLTPELAADDRWLFVVHNVYALQAAETGLLGLAAFLAFLGAAFRMASPERMVLPSTCRVALAWRAGLIALAWEMLWDVSLGPAANSLLWFLCGLTAAAARMRPVAESRSRSRADLPIAPHGWLQNPSRIL